jgi:putative CocE/NonD family hydrolase
MSKFNFILVSFIFYCFVLPFSTHAQDDSWMAFSQKIDASGLSGKSFKLEGAIRTESESGGMALLFARVEKADKSAGFFDNMLDRPATENNWKMYEVSGVIDEQAATLHVGIVTLLNGAFYFDQVHLSIETSPGKWEAIPLSNPGFEENRMEKMAPAGWSTYHASANFETDFQSSATFEGAYSLKITGAGLEEDQGINSYAALSKFVKENYDKYEYQVPARDGIKLYTIVYVPKDASPSNTYPMMMQRTCYSVGPYGKDRYMVEIGPSEKMIREKYIFVHQDVRGRYMSEGVWTNMTPHIAKKKNNKDIDESSDTYDTIDWLLANVKNNNGRVGQWGISYPGFYTTAGAIDAHPALKASSPQAPVADFWFDDFHHNGAYNLGYFYNTPLFGTTMKKPSESDWFNFFDQPTPDSYRFYREMGSLKNGAKYYPDNFLWKELTTHVTYDDFWKSRRIIDHVKGIRPAILVVGGWFDAEDLYGALNTYEAIEKNNPGTYNTIVMGPFGHGDWSREAGHYKHHDIFFGDSLASFYQTEMEAPFFRHFLKEKGDGKTGLPEAWMFDTGKKVWNKYDQWPPAGVMEKTFYLRTGEDLSSEPPASPNQFSSYISDPGKPVPYTMDIPGSFGITPRNYMSEDQRFAASRPDVLVYETEPLTEEMLLAGSIEVELNVSTTGTDADWVVKLIDVYPGDMEQLPHTEDHIALGHYQQLVRSEVMRSRFRNSFVKPEPMVPGQKTVIRVKLQDVCHTFLPGHRMMIQVQSSWFPLIDLNPQKYVPNIFEANPEDYIKATQQVYEESRVRVRVLK